MKIIIIGAGEVGYNIAWRLSSENKHVVVIDNDAAAVRRLTEKLDVQVLTASGSDPVTLEKAGIREADILLAVTDSDEVNLVACLMASHLAPEIKKLARLRHDGFDPFHEELKTGQPRINTIINPETEVVNTIWKLLEVPGAVDSGSFVQGQIRYIGLRIHDASPVTGMSLIDFARAYGKDRPLISTIIRRNEVIVPRGKDSIQAGDLVYFICESDLLEKTLKIFGITLTPVRNVLIIGGGRTGEKLARQCAAQGVKTKIIESNLDRCNELSARLPQTVILHGDGSDQTLFLEENAAKNDAVVSVTNSDETNILSSLLARNLGVSNTITRVEKPGYHALLPAIGIEKVVSPRVSAISSILRDVRKGQVLSDISIFGEKGEFIEAVAMEASGMTGKPVRKIPFPKGSLLICIMRNGQTMIPTGESVVEPGDRIILFAVKSAIKTLEKLLTVRLGFF